jgi:hypothetical protein
MKSNKREIVSTILQTLPFSNAILDGTLAGGKLHANHPFRDQKLLLIVLIQLKE